MVYLVFSISMLFVFLLFTYKVEFNSKKIDLEPAQLKNLSLEEKILVTMLECTHFKFGLQIKKAIHCTLSTNFSGTIKFYRIIVSLEDRGYIESRNSGTVNYYGTPIREYKLTPQGINLAKYVKQKHHLN